MRRAVRVLLAVVTAAAILFLFVFPVRTLIDQRNQTGLAKRRIQGLAVENAALSKEAASLQTNAVIEQLARQRYGLQMPGDHVYSVLPAAPGAITGSTSTTLPSAPTGGG